MLFLRKVLPILGYAFAGERDSGTEAPICERLSDKEANRIMWWFAKKLINDH